MAIIVDLLSRTEAGARITSTQYDTFVAAIEAAFATAATDADLATTISLAASALQPADIASGTITARADDIDFSGGSDGDVLAVQADGSLALETFAGGGDMLAATYDPQVIGDDAFDLSTHTGSVTTAQITDAAVTNAKLANMAQATFKMRAAGAGTGVPIDGTATQAKTALAIAFTDITGDATLAQLPDIASPTVLANVTGSTGAPAAVSPATFKTEFGFGTLASLSNVTVSDISASGTPSSSTFLRGDGSWSGVVPAVSYEVTDLDNATTLTAAHSRYQIDGAALVITQLRLRNSSDQTAPVRIILEDNDSVSPAGAEFDLIQADDQTGICVIRAETNGSINGKSFASTTVADLVIGSSSGATCTITSAGAGLPSVSAGTIFELRNHSTAGNNGIYIATGSPTTSSLPATKLSGSNPANAASESADIDAEFIALLGSRSSAVIIIDANPEATPNARIEGETREVRSIAGETTFSDGVNFDGAVDFDGTADFDGATTFSAAITFDGSAAVTGGGKVVTNVELTDTAEGYLDAGNKNGGATFDYTQGAWQKCVATGNITSVTISNPPATGRVGTITLEIHQDGTGSKTIAWGAAYRFPGGTDFTLSTGANDIDIFTLSTRDGGTTWYAFEGGKDFAA